MDKETFNEFYLKIENQYELASNFSDDENIKIIITKEELRIIKVAINVYDKITNTIVDEMIKNK